MRCKPKLPAASVTQTMWLKTVSSISLLAIANAFQYFNLIHLDLPYLVFIHLFINNIVTYFCCHRSINVVWDFLWKLATSLSMLNEHCFLAKISVDVLMSLKQITEHFQISSAQRSHLESLQQLQFVNSVTTHLERRPSIYVTPASVETKANESFLSYKLFSLNLGKSSGPVKRNVKKSSESETSSWFELPRMKFDAPLSFDEIPHTWGSANTSRSSSVKSDRLSTSPASTMLLKPSRLSFSPSEAASPVDNLTNRANSSGRWRDVFNAPSHGSSSQRNDIASLSQTLYYSNTPRVVYVMPSAMAEQGYLKLVCYMFTLVVVYIIYNEYRLSRMYPSSTGV